MTTAAQNSKQFLAQKASAATPSYSFLGNNTTGWYLSNTNEMSAATNGTQRFVIDSSGNVGIGQSSITQAFANYTQLNISGSSGATIQMQSGSTNRANIVADSNGLYVAGLSGYMVFSTGGTGTGTERMRIDSSGNVYINNSTDTGSGEKFEVKGATLGGTAGNTSVNSAFYTPDTSNTTRLLIQDYRISAGTSHTTSRNLIQRRVDATSMGYVGFDSSATSIGWGTTEAMRVDSSGNVGIGTSSPSSYGLLTVLSTTAGSAKINIMDNSAGSAAPLLQFGVNSSNGFNTSDAARVWTTASASNVANLNFAAYNGGAPSTAQMVLTGGNVGIGTSSPKRIFEIAGTEPTVNMYRTNGGTDEKYWRIYQNDNSFKIGTVNDAFNAGSDFLITERTGNTVTNIRFINGGTDRMRIDSSGNLLVGYTSSNGSYKLQVNSQIFATNATIATSDGRYKENVSDVTNAMSLVSLLKPVTFNWKQHPVHNFPVGETDIGFIAQDVKQTLKNINFADQLVKSNTCKLPDDTEEEFLGIAEGKLVPLLVAAIQELKAEIDTLKGTK